jgi:drug/metabolite transporter (DMT)-like permease
MTKRRHIHTMNARRYLVLFILVMGSTLGDVFLSHGMKQVGRITVSRWHDLLFAATNPWIALGTLLLVVFMASYLAALSWADLSYIMPVTAFGNVLTALLAKFALHEQIPVARWAGILLITFGVGVIARGPSLTVRHGAAEEELAGSSPRSGLPNKPGFGLLGWSTMNQHHGIANLSFILLLVAFNTWGDLLMARAMRQVGDVAVLRKQAGLSGVVRTVLSKPSFYAAILCMAAGYFSLLAALSLIDLSVVIPATSSLGFLANLFGAKFFLKEHLDRRRWIAGAVVLCGIALLANG